MTGLLLHSTTTTMTLLAVVERLIAKTQCLLPNRALPESQHFPHRQPACGDSSGAGGQPIHGITRPPEAPQALWGCQAGTELKELLQLHWAVTLLLKSAIPSTTSSLVETE